jgi:3-methyladenine DNA glycosylase AlkD
MTKHNVIPCTGYFILKSIGWMLSKINYIEIG